MREGAGVRAVAGLGDPGGRLLVRRVARAHRDLVAERHELRRDRLPDHSRAKNADAHRSPPSSLDRDDTGGEGRYAATRSVMPSAPITIRSRPGSSWTFVGATSMPGAANGAGAGRGAMKSADRSDDPVQPSPVVGA